MIEPTDSNREWAPMDANPSPENGRTLIGAVLGGDPIRGFGVLNHGFHGWTRMVFGSRVNPWSRGIRVIRGFSKND
jgi:hypothetical protein